MVEGQLYLEATKTSRVRIHMSNTPFFVTVVKVKAWKYGEKGAPYFPTDFEITRSDILQVPKPSAQFPFV